VAHLGGLLRQEKPRLASAFLEQADLDLLGDAGEEREVRADTVVGGAERIGPAGGNIHPRPLHHRVTLLGGLAHEPMDAL
jgi:hypothetical protein